MLDLWLVPFLAGAVATLFLGTPWDGRLPAPSPQPPGSFVVALLAVMDYVAGIRRAPSNSTLLPGSPGARTVTRRSWPSTGCC